MMSIHRFRSPRRRLPVLFFLSFCILSAQKFFPDDPVWTEPPPISVGKIEPQKLDNLIDFYKNTFHEKGERHRPGKIIPSAGTNSLGEVPDSAWYTNRQRGGRMTVAALATGPNRTGPPSPGSKWLVTAAKGEGVTPGFTIKDEAGRTYLLKFDPESNPELATGADVVSAKFLYALGYNVPENYPVRFRRDQLVIREGVEITDRWGRRHTLDDEDINDMLRTVKAYDDGSYRALASFYIAGDSVGPFKYYKRRADDPNELAPHEHLRVLRGLYVFAAWLNHTDAKALNSRDVIIEEKGRRFVKHYLIDFGATLGSDSLYAKDPRLGHEYFLAAKPGLVQLTTLGLYVPEYARVRYPDNPAVGNFASDAFDPDNWKSNYPNAAFESRLPGDEFWAAKQVMAFSDEEIRAIVATGDYSDPDTARIIADTLIRRRDAIGRTFFSKVLPLDAFRIENNRLIFEDLAVKYQLKPARTFDIAWSRFDNGSGAPATSSAGSGPGLPAAALSSANGTYWSARVHDPAEKNGTTVFVRKDRTGWTVVGIEREGENAWRPR
jgi:hypothetical protein